MCAVFVNAPRVYYKRAAWEAFPLHSGVNITLLSSQVTLCLVTLHFS